ncbi:MAG TPA: isochorismatase family protein [Acidimicrobiales bacterium]|nr:isochorismatase family protein [Acidimicrobiales bacterium]
MTEAPTPTSASRIPVPTGATLPAATTAALVLDLTSHGPAAPERVSYLERVGNWLDYAREKGLPICYTGISLRMTEDADPLLRRRSDEPLWYPAAYDKFYGGEIVEFLTNHKTENIVILGSATNNCVMYTATTAARHHAYEIYVPIDGSYVEDPYRHEYALYQLSILPSAPKKVQFTTLDTTTFI